MCYRVEIPMYVADDKLSLNIYLGLICFSYSAVHHMF